MISIQVTGDDAVRAKLAGMPERLRAGLASAISALGRQLQSRVKENLSGAVLKAKTGRLRDSIGLDVTQDAQSVMAAVGTSVLYGRVHEYGVGHSWLIQARAAKTLRFAVGNQVIFARSVTHPPAPQRSFLRSALKDIEPQVRAQVEAAVATALHAP